MGIFHTALCFFFSLSSHQGHADGNEERLVLLLFSVRLLKMKSSYGKAESRIGERKILLCKGVEEFGTFTGSVTR